MNGGKLRSKWSGSRKTRLPALKTMTTKSFNKIIFSLKEWNLRISVAALAFFSIFMFCGGITNNAIIIPANDGWMAILYGWAGITIAIKMAGEREKTTVTFLPKKRHNK